MDETSRSDATPGAETGSVKETAAPRRRLLWRLAVSLLALLLLLVALLPTLLSTGPARRLALGKVNAKMSGQIEVNTWSLGWLTGFRLEGLALRDPSGATVIEVAEVKGSTSLFGLIGGSLGTVAVNSPKLNLALRQDGGSNLLDALRDPAESKAQADRKDQDQGGSKAPPKLPVLAGELQVRGGEIRVTAPGVATPLLVRQLDVDLHLGRTGPPVRLSQKALLGAGGAPITVETTLDGPLPPPAGELPAGTTLLTWASLDLAEFSPVARHFGAPVDFAGMTGGNVTIRADAGGRWQAVGKTDLRGAFLSGGPLGQDHPAIATASLAFDLAMESRTLTVKEFAMLSPLATASASGAMTLPEAGGRPAGNLTVATRVHLAEIARQLPGTLRLRAGLTPVAGTLSLNAKLSAAGDDRSTVALVLRLDDLAAEHQGRRVELDQPVAGTALVDFSPTGIAVEKMELLSSFVKVAGHGRREDLTLLLACDLAAARREAAKFADLGARDAAGTVRLSLRIQGEDPLAPRLESELSLDGLALTGFTPAPVQLATASLTAAANLHLTPQGKLEEVREIQLGLKSPVATTACRIERLVPGPGGRPELVGGQLGTTSDLAQVALLARNAGLLPADADLGGWLRFATEFAARDGRFTANNLNLKVTQARCRHGQRQFADDEISLRTAELEVRPAARALLVKGVMGRIAGALVVVNEFSLSDWARAPLGIATAFSCKAGLANLLAAAGGFIPVPAGMQVGGGLNLTGEMTAAANGLQPFSLEMQLLKLQVVKAGETLVKEDQVQLTANGTVNAQSGATDLPTLSVKSPFLNLDAQASLSDLQGKRRLAFAGKLDCDFDRIGLLATTLSGQPIVLGGKHEGPFQLATDLNAADWRERLLATTATLDCRLAKAGYADLVATEVESPLSVRDGLAQANLRAALGGGKFNLPATIDANPPVAALTLPPDTTVIADVDLSNEVVAFLLSRYLPLFQGSTAAKGKVSLLSRDCFVPITGEIVPKVRFHGLVGFAGGQLQAAGFLRDVLALADLAREPMTLPDQQVAVRIQDGMAVQERLVLRAGGHPVAVYGAMSLADQQLDYWVELPVTPAMLGRRQELYALLKGEVIRVHIDGPAKQPRIARDTYRENLSRLIGTAATRLLQDGGGDLLRRGLEELLK